jgi:hypothetical protein
MTWCEETAVAVVSPKGWARLRNTDEFEVEEETRLGNTYNFIAALSRHDRRTAERVRTAR